MKNFLAAGLAVLAIGFCCFGHIFLASLGGAGLIMGLFTNKILLVTIGLIVLAVGFLYFLLKTGKLAGKKITPNFSGDEA